MAAEDAVAATLRMIPPLMRVLSDSAANAAAAARRRRRRRATDRDRSRARASRRGPRRRRAARRRRRLVRRVPVRRGVLSSGAPRARGAVRGGTR